MPVKLNSTGGGSVTLTTPSTATDYTLTVPAVTGSALVSTSGASTSTTGIDFPSANTVSIKTNGTTAVTVDSSQNVGIGTSSPTARLQVSQTSADANCIIEAVTGGYAANITLLGNNATGSRFSYLTSKYGTTEQWSIGGGGVDGTIVFRTGSSVTERARIDSSGNVLVTGAGGLGYGTGSGGAVTQATSKSTSVTLNKASGQIVMNNAALAASTTVTFQLNNTVISGSDIVLVTLYDSVTTSGSYQVWATDTRSGNCQINLRNMTAGSLSNAVYLNFAVIKGVWS